MRQSDHEYEERSFRDIQRAIDFENSMNDLEAQLYYRRLSPKEVAQQVLRATCQFYDADWCGLIQVDLDLSLWTPFWWFNTGATDKTMLLTEEYESAEFLDRWVQAVRKGIPMVVLDAEATKKAYPAEYDLYRRLGIQSVIAVSLEPRPVALLAVRNPAVYPADQYAADSGLCAACIVQRTENAEPASDGIYPHFYPKQQGYLCQSVWRTEHQHVQRCSERSRL